MMIQLLIQFQKYILSTIYIYIYLFIYEFFNWKWFQSIDELFSTIRFLSRIRHVIFIHTHTHTRARHPIRKRIVSIFHPCFLRRRSWRIWRIQPSAENGENERRGKEEERERKRNDGVFFFSGPWRVESARLKYRAGGIMLRQRWVNGDVDRRKFHSAHGRARRSMFQLGKKWKNRWLGEKLVCSFWFKKLPTFVIGYITKEDLSIVPWIVLPYLLRHGTMIQQERR